MTRKDKKINELFKNIINLMLFENLSFMSACLKLKISRNIYEKLYSEHQDIIKTIKYTNTKSKIIFFKDIQDSEIDPIVLKIKECKEKLETINYELQCKEKRLEFLNKTIKNQELSLERKEQHSENRSQYWQNRINKLRNEFAELKSKKNN